jgi:acyl-CoA thioesterase II
MTPPQLSPPAVPPPPASDTESDPGRSEPQIDEATYTWQRAQYDGDDSHTHKLIAAFLSDFSLLFSAFAPHMHHRAVKELRMIASLDHAIYFHAPIRVDEWCLYEMRSTWAGGSRALSFGRIYNHEGVLAMSTVQEGLIRTSPNFESTATINSKL